MLPEVHSLDKYLLSTCYEKSLSRGQGHTSQQSKIHMGWGALELKIGSPQQEQRFLLHKWMLSVDSTCCKSSVLYILLLCASDPGDPGISHLYISFSTGISTKKENKAKFYAHLINPAAYLLPPAFLCTFLIIVICPLLWKNAKALKINAVKMLSVPFPHPSSSSPRFLTTNN